MGLEYGQQGHEYLYWIQFSGQQKMARTAIDEAVSTLFKASKSAQGQYNGWKCELISGPPAKKSRWKSW
jgi:hypothetical protein